MLLNPDQTNIPISKEEQEKERRRDQTNTAQLLHQKIRHWPGDHQVQPSPPASSRILTPLLLPHCPHPQLISHWLRSWGTINQKPDQWRVFSLPSRPAQLPEAPSPRREHINQADDPSFHYHFCCFCWSLLGGFDTFNGLDTF